jgi:hypothetical protein
VGHAVFLYSKEALADAVLWLAGTSFAPVSRPTFHSWPDAAATPPSSMTVPAIVDVNSVALRMQLYELPWMQPKLADEQYDLPWEQRFEQPIYIAWRLRRQER